MRALIALLFCVSFLTLNTGIVVAAQYQEDDAWSYGFYLEYKDGVLNTDPSQDIPYLPIPEKYTDNIDPKTSDYYGVITNLKGVEVGRFGFNKPDTIVPALGKSLYIVRAPYFGDGNVVKFYTNSGKSLFQISVAGSAVCNDDKKCNTDAGENYTNCSYDCPPPETTTTQPQYNNTQPNTETQPQTTVTPPQNTEISPTITQTNTSSTPESSPKTTTTIIVLSIIFIILLGVLWKVRTYNVGE